MIGISEGERRGEKENEERRHAGDIGSLSAI